MCQQSGNQKHRAECCQCGVSTTDLNLMLISISVTIKLYLTRILFIIIYSYIVYATSACIICNILTACKCILFTTSYSIRICIMTNRSILSSRTIWRPLYIRFRLLISCYCYTPIFFAFSINFASFLYPQITHLKIP